ncbi:MAG: aminotransferase class I/II-fold pyridoxal phosphate-dependent enzyme [Acidobacteriota bacterium]
MTKTTFATPPARSAVADPGLTRPDWTRGTPRDPRLLWLDKNENADPELNAVTQRVLAGLDPKMLYTYPESRPLYDKLAAWIETSPDHLVLAAGSDGVIRSVFEAFIERGDVVVHTAPTFAMYPVYSKMYAAKAVTLDYRPSSAGPELVVDDFARAIGESGPRVVCLPNPDSPTGTVFSPEDLRRIIELAGEAGAVMLVDEAYHPFYPHSIAGWVDEYPHLVVARTFAKAWGLAGLRIGYAVAHPDMAVLLHKVRPMYEVNTVAVAAMERMLDFRHEMEASVRRLNAGRNGFLDAMEALGLNVLRAKGNFLHVAFGEKAERVHEALANQVLYRKDDPYGSPLKGYSRFSATTPALFAPIVETIRKVYA